MGGSETGADDPGEMVTKGLTRQESSRPMGRVNKTKTRQHGSNKTPTVAKKKEYKQGLRRMKQEIERGVQPRILKFLADHGEEPVHGGQPPQTGGGGWGCVPSPVRKRSCPSNFDSPSKRTKSLQRSQE